MVQKHLFLTGYRGSGKSTIGKLVASHLSRAFVDTDVEIELQSGNTIAEIFARSGEAAFRDLESKHISQLRSLTEPAVVSLGGGSILRQENRECIKQLGRTVWLQASPENICDRISKDVNTQTRRPKLSKLGDLEEIRSILAERSVLYEEVADMCVSTDELSMESAAMKIVHWYRAST